LVGLALLIIGFYFGYYLNIIFWVIGEIDNACINITDTETLRIDGNELVIRTKNTLLEPKNGESSQEKQETIDRNRRAILQFFNIKVIVYPERVDIKETIPTQMMGNTQKGKEKIAPIITSAPLGREGEEFLRGATPHGTT
jgi:hypothetical protein